MRAEFYKLMNHPDIKFYELTQRLKSCKTKTVTLSKSEIELVLEALSIVEEDYPKAQEVAFDEFSRFTMGFIRYDQDRKVMRHPKAAKKLAKSFGFSNGQGR